MCYGALINNKYWKGWKSKCTE